MFIFLPEEPKPLPPTLAQLIADSWTFPTDYPVVNNTNSPDGTRTLKAVIAYALTEHYKYHRICNFNKDYFSQRLSQAIYITMVQHQYWIDQFLGLIADNQFFYNEEWNDGGTHTVESNDRSTSSSSNNLARTSDTPQNMIGDIDNYLTAAQKDEGGETGSENIDRDTQFTTDLHVKKSTLGDITVQFNNFANFPKFMDVLIKAVVPCFMTCFNDDEVDYGTSE